jgi:guanylate kinase
MSSERRAGPARGELFLLSAPSGAGKTTLIRNVMDAVARAGGAALEFSVSHTTRAPRQGEVAGKDYQFVGVPEFQAMIAADQFLEWAEVHGHYYGTSAQAVLPYLERGTDVLVDLDVQGAERLMHRFPEAHSIFVLPPSYADLVSRLRGRRLDGPAEIAGRLAVSLWEIRRYDRYQYVIINADAQRASHALEAIVVEKRQRRQRMQAEIESILADFARQSDT